MGVEVWVECLWKVVFGLRFEGVGFWNYIFGCVLGMEGFGMERVMPALRYAWKDHR